MTNLIMNEDDSIGAVRRLQFNCLSNGGAEMRQVDIDTLIIAGWAGKDKAALQAHIAELEEQGIKTPQEIPRFYRIGPNLLTQASSINVVGKGSTGEVEAFAVHLDDGLWVGLGSDHTDRKVESLSVSLSKQVCPKPIGTTLWKFDDIADHWNELIIRSFVVNNGRRQTYQEGSLVQNRDLSELILLYRERGGTFSAGTAMFCGTLPAKIKLTFFDQFELELHDPVLDRSLSHCYAIHPLPIDGYGD